MKLKILYYTFLALLVIQNSYGQDLDWIKFSKRIKSEEIFSSQVLSEINTKIKEFNKSGEYQVLIDVDALVNDLSKKRDQNKDWEKEWRVEREKQMFHKYKAGNGGKNKGILFSVLFLLEKPVEENASWKARSSQFISTGTDVPMYFRTMLASYKPSGSIKYGINKEVNDNILRENIDYIISKLLEDPKFANNKIQIGPFSVAYKEMIDAYDYHPDDRNFKLVKLVDPTFVIDFGVEELYKESKLCTGAEISLYFHENSATFIGASLKYNGEIVDLKKMGFLEIKLKSFDIQVSGTETSIVSGNILLQTSTIIDQEVYPHTWLKSGVNGTVNFAFNAGDTPNSLYGDFDFHDVKNINVELRKEKVVAALTGGSLNSKGEFQGNLVLKEDASFVTPVATIKLTDANLKVKGDFRKEIIYLDQGSAKAQIKDIVNVKGTIAVDMNFDPDGNVQISVDQQGRTPLACYGLVMNRPEIEINTDISLDGLELKIKGSARHEEYDADLKINDLHIKDGKILKFEGEGGITYSGYLFKLQSFSYTNNTVIASASINIESNYVNVEKFEIANNGSITLGKISGNLNYTAMKIKFDAEFKGSAFSGNFTCDTKGLKFDGGLTLGMQMKSDKTYFNYCFGRITTIVQGGIPLSPLPLKINQLGGQIGYNYKLEYKQPTNKSLGYNGSILQNAYMLGLNLGISDVSNQLISVSGNALVQIQPDENRFNLSGTVKVPVKKPYLTANANLSYVIPQNILEGDFTTSIKVPQTSGFIFQSSNMGLNFKVDGSGWNISRDSITATVLKSLKFDGNVDLNGDFEKLENTRGTLNGKVSFSFVQNIKESFEYNDTKLASMEFAADLSGSLSGVINIKDEDIEASLSTKFDGKVTASVNILEKYNLLKTQATLTQNGNATVNSNNFHLDGLLVATFEVDDEKYSGSAAIDYTHTFR